MPSIDSLPPLDDDDPHAVARRLIEAGRYEESIELLLVTAGLRPRDPAVPNDLGVAYMATHRFAEAIPWLERSIALEPEVGSPHYNLGLALQHLGDDEAAIVAHRRAGALSPDLSPAHAQLADLLWERGLRDDAVAAYERAYASAPRTSVGRLCRAKALLADRRHGEAEAELRRLIADDPSNGMAHVLLGKVLQEIGRFEDATASYERSIELNPSQANGYYGVASSRRFTLADRPWVERLVGRLETSQGEGAAHGRHRMMLHFAAGKALDDLGDYEDAMRHFRAANVIRRGQCPFHRGDVERAFERIMGTFTRERARESAVGGNTDETPILVVGVPRSGTTLIERILASHPEVRGRGELTFWNERAPAWMDADADARARSTDELRSDYVELLHRGGPRHLRGVDKMPFNFLWLGLVHLVFPRARIVHARRDARDTCLSIFTTPVTGSWGFASTLPDLAWYHRQYVRLFDHWRATLAPDRMLDVDYEDVVANPESAARRIVDFAGLTWDPACARPEENRDAVATASSWQARQPIYRSSVERWRRYEPWLEELREL